ncbi:MAG: leucyl aminopeptidase [Alphaproteobacteria bacterium]|nr:leucyl aminopeptidase [Alphaproteobacteria bacterium]
MDVKFSEFGAAKDGVLVVGAYDGGRLSKQAQAADKKHKGALSQAMKRNRFKGGRGQLLDIVGLKDARVALVGLGKADGFDALAAEQVGGTVAARYLTSGESRVTFALDVTPDVAVAAALAAVLRSYRFDKYRTRLKDEQKPSLKRIDVQSDDPAAAKKLWKTAEAVAEGVRFTRDLVTEPANVIFPQSFADRCEELKEHGIEVEVLGEKELKALGAGAILGVGQGSTKETKMVVLQWKGGKDGDAPVALVGKGVTFDTGGISLKPGDGMWDMKWDMGGAGTIAGAMKALALRKAKANVVAVLGLVENMPDGDAQRPGDIVTSRSGQTIEVWNTDAEGRLVLADALWYCQERFKPRCMVDLATLTGAIMIALGLDHAGLFSNDDTLSSQLTAAGKGVGEELWRLPLVESLDRAIDSACADMKNITGNRNGGSIVGAMFLQRFVNKVKWAHLDIAGVVWSGKARHIHAEGATGYGVRLLDRFVKDTAEG